MVSSLQVNPAEEYERRGLLVSVERVDFGHFGHFALLPNKA